MLDILKFEVYNLREALAAAHNSMTLHANYPDTEVCYEESPDFERAARLAKLGGGSGHTNFRKGIVVALDIRYPQYWSMEAQRYKFFEIISSTSKMHTLLKMNLQESCNKFVDKHTIRILEDKIDEYNAHVEYLKRMKDNGQAASKVDLEISKELWMKVISNVPMGLELEMHVVTNYEQLATIYRQRRNHRLVDWQVFCDWIERLPYAKELITYQE